MENVKEKIEEEFAEEEMMQKRIRELVKIGEKLGLVQSYADYVKTEEARETLIPKEDIEYYEEMCKNGSKCRKNKRW